MFIAPQLTFLFRGLPFIFTRQVDNNRRDPILYARSEPSPGFFVDGFLPRSDIIPLWDCTTRTALTFNIPICCDAGILLEVKYVFMDIPRENFPKIAIYMKSLIL